MLHSSCGNGGFTLGLAAAVMAGALLFAPASSAGANERGPRSEQYRQYREPAARPVPPPAPHMAPRASQAPPVPHMAPRAKQAPPPRDVKAPLPRPIRPGLYLDSRYRHDRSYPVRGRYIQRLPRDHRVIVHGRTRYYYHRGAWYRPYGPRFAVVAPPFGLVVPYLPPYYATVWFGGIPYYYANEIYYTRVPNGYAVVAPPSGEASETPPPEVEASIDQLFIYPRQGQSEAQQAKDRYECHAWAVQQTGYDPTRPREEDLADPASQKPDDYRRAMGACLDGRGYTVK